MYSSALSVCNLTFLQILEQGRGLRNAAGDPPIQPAVILAIPLVLYFSLCEGLYLIHDPVLPLLEILAD